MIMSNMIWKIRESSHGGFYAEKGLEHKGGVELGFCPGVTMPCFMVYESTYFDTYKQAERHIKSRTK